MAVYTRGGLAPSALRRVRDYIDTHLDQNIRLQMLAKAAGLSVYHFARVFKDEVGVPPHGYLLQQRVERAREMLANTELPLSKGALAAGFADQSHLARHFRRFLGVSPSLVRRSRS